MFDGLLLRYETAFIGFPLSIPSRLLGELWLRAVFRCVHSVQRVVFDGRLYRTHRIGIHYRPIENGLNRE